MIANKWELSEVYLQTGFVPLGKLQPCRHAIFCCVTTVVHSSPHLDAEKIGNIGNMHFRLISGVNYKVFC